MTPISEKSASQAEVRFQGRKPIQKLSRIFSFKSQNSFDGSENASPEDKFGLFEFHPESPECCIDVIAVHGLGGHHERTWTWNPVGSTGEKPCVWLRDLLPSEIPNARILSFGYSSAVAFSKSIGDISTFAEQLLSLTLRERASENQRSRPVVFVAHSLGGIVVKKALEYAQQRRDQRPECLELLKSIKGILFMGTPHGGSNSALYGGMCADMLKAACLGTRTNSALIKELKQGSRTLFEISKNFPYLGAHVSIYSFIETDRMDFLSQVIVTEKSARLNLVNEDVYHLNANHSTLSRDLISEDLSTLDFWHRILKNAAIILFPEVPKVLLGFMKVPNSINGSEVTPRSFDC
ncbi:hypothetical protein PITC_059230 [Penicillium italicum]|uniref:DUF676 domain-containing protein n=1 Tax=Penicillium italicum TaxID=40296 RepID=A0A0A2LPX4_PENIT|nr:hypothetical protein PITC_059230 [Penicillium italicum]